MFLFPFDDAKLASILPQCLLKIEAEFDRNVVYHKSI